MTLEAGTRLGHYRIISLLGRGGMADVYRAEDERLGREVGLKAVPPEFARDPERIERFEHEVRAAARLTHPNIVTVYEFGQGAGQHFYTMALMPGGDLKARIRAHPDGMPPEEARAVAAAMARALDYAHKRGLVHRDVKPENILFGEDGAPQLTDFGIARAMSSGTRMTATGMSIGSPHYMSPEQARGQAVDGRSDLYSLGVVLYEMLTGRVPFDAGDTLAVAYSHVNDPVPKLPPAQQEWQPVVDRLLAKSPDDRFGSAGDLAEVLASDALPQPSATRVTPGRRSAGLAARSKQMATQLMSAPRDGGQAGRLKELIARLAAAAKSPRGTPVAVAGGALLALVVVGIGYVAVQDAARTPRQASTGGEGESALRSAEAQRTPVQPVRPSNRRSPFGADGRDRALQALSNGSEADAEAPPSPPPLRERLPVLGGGALLVVETTPSGVEVLVDGTPVGETPLERSDIGAGVRQVTLRHPQYETVVIPDRNFQDGTVLRVERTLRLGVGQLTVTVTPRDAWVEMGGRRLADRTPVTLERLPAGRVQLTVGATEHRPLTVEVDIPKDGLARLEPTLERIPYGSLTVEVAPPHATVTLPSARLQYRPGMRLPEGQYRVVVDSAGWGQGVRTVDVSGATRVQIALEKGPGALQVFDGMEFVWIPAGEFQMGSTSQEAAADEEPVTRVRISRGFWLGKHEVTQAEWQLIMGSNPSYHDACGRGCPVERMSWNDVQQFIGRLNGRAGGGRYRLPTEAEWEYAARARTTRDRYLARVPACGSSRTSDTTAGRTPNAWGLQDTLGNVAEWVADWYGDYPGGSVTDPSGPASGSYRVFRGGSYLSNFSNCRAPRRGGEPPGASRRDVGFRLLRVE